MNKTKKVLTVVLSAIMVLAMVVCITACGSKPSGGNNTNTNDAKSKYTAAVNSWDNATGKKTVTDNIAVKISVPFSGKAIDLDVQATIAREYKGSDIVSASAALNYIGVSGAVSDLLPTLSGLGLNLNKIIKIGGTEDVDGEEYSYYELKDGTHVYYYENEEGKKEYFTDAGSCDEPKEDDFKYYTLLKNNMVVFGEADAYGFEDALANGTLTVDDGAFAVEGAADVAGLIKIKGEYNVPESVLTMDDINGLLKKFNLSIDFDKASILDLANAEFSESNGKIAAKVAFKTAMSVFINQIDSIFSQFMDSQLDGKMIEVFNSFSDDDVELEEGIKALDMVRGWIETFESVLDGDNLSDKLFNLLDMSKVDAKVTLANDKLSKIEGTQTGSLTITSAQIDDVVTILNQKKIPEQANGNLRNFAPFAEVEVDALKAMTVGKLENLVKSFMFEADACTINIEVTYKSSFKY